MWFTGFDGFLTGSLSIDLELRFIRVNKFGVKNLLWACVPE
jgi:hypothetical protein